MNNEIELRDFLAAQLMSGKVNDFYSQSYREKLGDDWIQISAEEATKRIIERAAKMPIL
jgi:hypothetical protein